MSVYNFPQFEDNYDVYKMRAMVDEVVRQFQAIQQESPISGGGGGGGVTVHNDLTGRSDPDCHPIAAITGLQAALNLKANQSDLLALALVVNGNTVDIAALDVRVTALEDSAGWHEFIAQSANPGVVPANTLYQDDGSNFTADSLVWGDPVASPNPSVWGANHSIGNPGTEQGGINVAGVNFDATAKINSVGGAIDATLILHRHSTSFSPNFVFARTNDDTIGHTAVTTTQVLGSTVHVGWSGTHYDIASIMQVTVPTGSTVSPTSLAGQYEFYTTPDGSNTALLAMIIGSDQIIYGDQVAGGILELQGAAHSAPDLGIVQINSPVTMTYDTFSNTTPAQQFAVTWNPTPAVSALYIGGYLSTAAVFTITTGVFVPAIFSDTNNYLVGAVPGFSAITFINELSVVENSGNFNLPSALVMNVGLTHERNTAGTSTTPGTTGVSFSPQTRATIAGGIITKTDQTALRCSVTYSTVGGSTANMGNIRGVDVFTPALALFQPGAGAETASSIIGLDYRNQTFGGNIVKAAVRSAHISSGTNSYFLLNNGNAVSDFLSSNIHFNDLFGLSFGTGATLDLNIGIIAGGVLFFNWTSGDTGQLRMSSEVPGNTTDRFLWFSTVSAEYTFDCDRFSIGAQTGSNGNSVGNFVTPARTIGIGGDWADFLLTQGGSLTVGGLAMGRVSAWVINGISYAASAGTVGNADSLTVGGFPTSSPGVTITERQSLHVIAGRSRLQSAMQYDPINPTILGSGNTNDWAGLLTGTANNGMRHWARIDGNADGTSIITGIDATFAQDGDTFKITNDGAFNVSFGNQDVASTAANRIITGTGATYILGPDESCEITYDLTTARWRILYGSGA